MVGVLATATEPRTAVGFAAGKPEKSAAEHPQRTYRIISMCAILFHMKTRSMEHHRVNIPPTPRLVEALRRHGSASLADLAAELGLTVASVSANLGGLHDYGYVTRMGTQPTSIARWDGTDDDYVLRCLERVAA